MNFEAVETSSELFLGFLWSILRMNHEKHMLKMSHKSEVQNLASQGTLKFYLREIRYQSKLHLYGDV